MPRVFRIRNWAKFQHYKDRNPPWIKLHVAIFASEDWVMLDDASKLLAVVCMVIAAKNDGNVPDNPDYIRRVAYLKKLPNLTPLIESGFLVITQADDSECKQVLAGDGMLQADARPETETSSSKKSNKSETDKKEVLSRFASEGDKQGQPPAPSPKPSRKKPRSGMPEVFPTPDDKRWAFRFWSGKGRADLCEHIASHADHCRDHHISKGTLAADWPATWRTWARNALKHNSQFKRKESTHEQGQRIGLELIREISSDHAPDYRADHSAGAALPDWPDDDGRGAESVAEGPLRRLGAS